jgi:hypothetical protein
MTILIQQEIAGYLPAKRHTNSKGWQSFNAVCCPHNGETMDKRGRGGAILNPDGGVSYHCFNCQFKASYAPGRPLSYKFRKLLGWMGVDDNTIHKLAIEALREKERQELLGIIKPTEVKEELKVSFKKHELPDEAVTFMGLVEFYELQQSHEYPENFVKAVEYVDSRKISMRKYDFYVTQDIKHKMDKRVIIPFTWKGQTIGYTARAMVDGITPKYYNEVDSGYVFNIDKQERDWKFVIVCEGIFDAMSLDGVACMGSNITAQQIDLIEDLDREIIVVPDWNKTGGKLIDIALANKWAVAFPVWAETCADINEAVQKYGKLFVMKSIIDSVERSNLKIQLKRKQLR